jgi:hypothetical protein
VFVLIIPLVVPSCNSQSVHDCKRLQVVKILAKGKNIRKTVALRLIIRSLERG